MFEKVMNKIWEVEHRNNPRLVLHANKKENNYTCFGIYPYTKIKSHKKIKAIIDKHKIMGDASVEIAFEDEIYQDVLSFYRDNFWDKLFLDKVDSKKKCEELMVFFVNVGIKPETVAVMQQALGVYDDGVFGVKTLKALQDADEDEFGRAFDACEIEYYQKLIEKNPKLKWAFNGWVNRANIV